MALEDMIQRRERRLSILKGQMDDAEKIFKMRKERFEKEKELLDELKSEAERE